MKKLPLILLLMLFARLNAQTPEVGGIGRFRLGKTTIKVIDSLVHELKQEKIIKVSTLEGEQNIKKKSNCVARLMPDTIDFLKGPLDAKLCPDAKVYLLTNYTIAGIELKNILLTYLNDTLASIKADGTKEIIDAMKTKYGEGESKYEHEIKNCSLHEDELLTYLWKGNDYSAKCQIISEYTYNCEHTISSILYILRNGFPDAIDRCDNRIIEKQEKKAAEEKKKKLSEF